MKRFLVILFLCVAPTTAMAEWTLIQTNDDGNSYVDFETLQKSGDTVNISTLNDFYDVQQRDELSTQWIEMHDCKNKRFKPLTINYYSGNMALGKLIESATFDETKTAWSDVVPYSVGELKANIICSK